MNDIKFPKDFIWGAAAASYQIEGASYEDGRGESIWDRFSHNPGNVINNDTGDIACNHYHLYKEDIQLMKKLGIKSYRFSISWPRIFPDGFGEPNEKGIQFYINLVNLLIENNITPAVTLYHWDLPQKLQDMGGWANREIVNYFENYCKYVLEKLGSKVPVWITHNEPFCASILGYGIGEHAPGIKDYSTALLASYNILLSHGKVVKLFRNMNLNGEIGITLNLSTKYPASNSDEDIQAAKISDGFMNRWFLDPILKGEFPKDMLDLYKNEGLIIPQIRDEDLKMMNEKNDFLGINYYSSDKIQYDSSSWPFRGKVVYRGLKRTDMTWEIHPEGLYDLLMYMHKNYNDIKIIMTENGAAFKDTINDEGKVEDDDRIDYINNHLFQASRAIKDGVNLKGYFAWSIMDNFEWAFGYSKRFGLVYVDYKTQKRIIKKSGYWYKNFIEKHTL